MSTKRYHFRRMVVCHMLADMPAELHELDDRIGAQRTWFQRYASAPHYDICEAKSALAGRGRRDRVDRAAQVRRDHSRST